MRTISLAVMTAVVAITMTIGSVAAFAGSSYVRYVKPMDQNVIRNPKSNNNKKRFEGCGPIAQAMVLGYWQTEHRYQTMHYDDRFNGAMHPWKTIRTLYRKSAAMAAPVKSKWTDGKKYPQTFTLPAGLMNGLRYYVKQANKKRGSKKKLKVDRMTQARTWKKRHKTLRSLLSKRIPVILLLKNIPGCLRSSNNKSGGWHYVVAVGHNDSSKNYYILSGWNELHYSTTSGPGVHKRRSSPDSNAAHVKCSYNEIKKAKAGLFWVKKK